MELIALGIFISIVWLMIGAASIPMWDAKGWWRPVVTFLGPINIVLFIVLVSALVIWSGLNPKEY